MKIREITPSDADYPDKLRNLASPPQLLYALGDLSVLRDKPCLSIVGSRKVTPYGKQVTLDLAAAAAGQGMTIISGLALGVDGLAHQAAIEAGGKTVAVLPSGLDTIYPSTHHHLAKRILQTGGALITEYPFGTEAYKTNFVARNRIVSGLADGILITEAAEKSGTLHTANFALEQGRTVMAVPGNITSSQSKGTNSLIRAGATIVTGIDDILEALSLTRQQASDTVLAANEHEAVLLRLLGKGISDSAELLAQSGMETPLFNQTLTMLEITGKIRPLGAGHWGKK